MNVGFPRQTPMLAGRVAARGPYGWHGESADLNARGLYRLTGDGSLVEKRTRDRRSAVGA